ncbi:MAG: hypothetical protein DRI90_09695 [Deltaproteobacteria bacterium]|nr:MAG: hypothetical protein DRI90_09695 [Deltaproteobacteria bacterium]
MESMSPSETATAKGRARVPLSWTLAVLVCTASCRDQPDGAAEGSAVSATGTSSAPGQVAKAPLLTELPPGDRALDLRQADGLVAAGQARVEPISVGREPRRLLRYGTDRPAAGRLVVTIDIAMTVGPLGEAAVEPAVPPLRVVLDAQVKPAAQIGTPATVGLVMAEVALEPRNEGERAVAVAMKPLIVGLRGLRCSFPLAPRGLRRPPLMPTVRTAPEVLQLWTTVAESVGDLMVPYPADEVGLGAQWRAFDRVRRAGIEMLRRTTYRIVALDARSVTIEADGRELAIASAGRGDPALPADRTVEVVRGSAHGTRAVLRSLGEFLPARTESKLMSQVTMDTSPLPEVEPGAVAMRSSVRLTQTVRVVRPGG